MGGGASPKAHPKEEWDSSPGGSRQQAGCTKAAEGCRSPKKASPSHKRSRLHQGCIAIEIRSRGCAALRPGLACPGPLGLFGPTCHRGGLRTRSHERSAACEIWNQNHSQFLIISSPVGPQPTTSRRHLPWREDRRIRSLLQLGDGLRLPIHWLGRIRRDTHRHQYLRRPRYWCLLVRRISSSFRILMAPAGSVGGMKARKRKLWAWCVAAFSALWQTLRSTNVVNSS